MNNKPNLTVLVTSCCTLKCKLCATYAPQNMNPHHYPKEIMMKCVDRFFDTMGNVKLFTMSGGEPFLHPDMLELIRYFKKWIPHMEKFEIITNGTIIPNEMILKELGSMEKVDIMIDDYGIELSKKVPELVKEFEKYGITHRVRKYYGEDAHLGGWLDISDFSNKNRTEKENEELFKKCMYSTTFKNHFFIIDGTAHMCYVNRKLLSDIMEKEDEYVNMMDESLSADEIKQQLLNLRQRKHLSVCAKCNGFCVDGKRYLPAEQM